MYSPYDFKLFPALDEIAKFKFTHPLFEKIKYPFKEGDIVKVTKIPSICRNEVGKSLTASYDILEKEFKVLIPYDLSKVILDIYGLTQIIVSKDCVELA